MPREAIALRCRHSVGTAAQTLPEAANDQGFQAGQGFFMARAALLSRCLTPMAPMSLFSIPRERECGRLSWPIGASTYSARAGRNSFNYGWAWAYAALRALGLRRQPARAVEEQYGGGINLTSDIPSGSRSGGMSFFKLRCTAFWSAALAVGCAYPRFLEPSLRWVDRNP